MVTFHIQGLMDMVVPSSCKGFSVKALLMLLLDQTKIECLTLSHKEEIGMDLHYLFVLNIEKT